MATIFDKQQNLVPSKMHAVADRRFEDARALCEAGNQHANGAQYFAGLVIEILLKAQLVRKYPNVARKRSHEQMDENDRTIWGLIWRSHELDDMRSRLTEMEAALAKKEQRDRIPYLTYLRAVCAEWTIHARYSSVTTSIQNARDMLDRVEAIKELLK